MSSVAERVTPIAENGHLRLWLPSCEPGIGRVVRGPGDSGLISGVELEDLKLWPDDRGYFAEVMRAGQGLVANYPAATTQVSSALSYPGTIKAFHYHLEQHDVWVAISGMLQATLVDLRLGSPTFGVKNTLYFGELNPLRVRIPPGVGHGYKVIGARPAVLVYVTDRIYNPKDEGRIAYNDTSIAYDWELQHK